MRLDIAGRYREIPDQLTPWQIKAVKKAYGMKQTGVLCSETRDRIRIYNMHQQRRKRRIGHYWRMLLEDPFG